MLIQLQPMQVSLLWGNIRDTALMTNQIKESKKAEYSTQLLKNLMLGKFQCWVCYDEAEEGKRIHAIGVTAITDNLAYGEKGLNIVSLYGYRTLTDELREDAFRSLAAYARNENCKVITASTSVGRIEELCLLSGFHKAHSTYVIEV